MSFELLPTGTFPEANLTPADLQFIGLFAAEGNLNIKRASIQIRQSVESPTCREIERISHGVPV
jgi:hypothetical protein